MFNKILNREIRGRVIFFSGAGLMFLTLIPEIIRFVKAVGIQGTCFSIGLILLIVGFSIIGNRGWYGQFYK